MAPFQLAVCLFAVLNLVQDSAAITPAVPADFSQLSWSYGFFRFTEKLAKEYAFGQWKEVDFEQLREVVTPLIAEAEANNDLVAYYKALKQYVNSIPDGKVQFVPSSASIVDTVLKQEVGGSYGIVAYPLDDGSWIASYVVGGSPADLHGIKAGAKLHSINGVPIATLAKNQDSWVWAFTSQHAVPSNKLIEKGRFIFRAPVGHTALIKFTNYGLVEDEIVELVATDDNYAGLRYSRLITEPENQPAVSHELWPEGYAYFKIYTFTDATVTTIQNALQSYANRGALGVVIDLRNNRGGSDLAAATIAQHFITRSSLYQFSQVYDSTNNTDKFSIDPTETIWLNAHSFHYGGPVVIIVNRNTMGSAEGFAHVLRDLPNVEVVGFTPTYGSFGIEGGSIVLPAGHSVLYPIGRSLDYDKKIQLDVDSHGRGGVQPTVRIPATVHTVVDSVTRKIDIESLYAIAALEDLRLIYKRV